MVADELPHELTLPGPPPWGYSVEISRHTRGSCSGAPAQQPALSAYHPHTASTMSSIVSPSITLLMRCEILGVSINHHTSPFVVLCASFRRRAVVNSAPIASCRVSLFLMTSPSLLMLTNLPSFNSTIPIRSLPSVTCQRIDLFFASLLILVIALKF
jgi:hypothetical protein